MPVFVLGTKVFHHRAEWGVMWGLLLYVFIVPNLDVFPDQSWHDSQRLLQLLLLATVSLVLVLTPVASTTTAVWKQLRRSTKCAILLLFAIGLLSAARAEAPIWALLEWAHLLLLLLGTLVISTARRIDPASADKLLIAVFFLTAMAYSGKTLVTYLAMRLEGPRIEGAWFDIRDFYTNFSNIRFFGHLQALMLPFLVLPAMLWARSRLMKALLLFVPAIWWALVSASASRGTWLALSVAVISVALFFRTTGWVWIRYQAASFGAGVALHQLVLVTVALENKYQSAMVWRETSLATLSRRDELWALAIRNFADHPWLGLGPMHFSHQLNPVAAHPHSLLLQMLAEWGAAATALVCYLMLVASRSFFDRLTEIRRDQGSAAAEPAVFLALFAALAGAAALSMIDGITLMPASQTVLVLLGGWAVAMCAHDAHGAQGFPSLSPVVKVMAVLAVILVAIGTWPDIIDPSRRIEEYYEVRPDSDLLMPRFWIQGWIFLPDR